MKRVILVAVLSLFTFSANAADLDESIKELQDAWTKAKYLSKSKKEAVDGLQACADRAEELTANFPNQAEIIIWEGICYASQGELLKISALGKVKKAKVLFEEAITIDDTALNGASYTNLGVLYQRVPGWPIGFGDDKKADENFKKAIAIAPENIDANYFYGLYLMDEDKYDEAKKHLELALNAPSRNRPLADKKRKEEIKKALEELNEEME